MSEVKFPALGDGSVLAILAAIGVLRLVYEFKDSDALLAWDNSDQCPVLSSQYASVDEVAEALVEIASAVPDGRLVPGGPAGFPLTPAPGETKDPMRVPPERLRRAVESVLRSASEAERTATYAWLAGLVTDLAVDRERRGDLSQLLAPAGRQTVGGSILKNPLDQVQKSTDYLRQALVGWRRVPEVTGEYLDHRAMWEAIDDAQGRPQMRGVPGATWLALMTLPMWLTTDCRGRARSSGWHTVRKGRRTQQELRLPLWREPLGPDGVRALVEHPALEGQWGDLDWARLRLLGVFHVARAHRRETTGKSAGILVTLS